MYFPFIRNKNTKLASRNYFKIVQGNVTSINVFEKNFKSMGAAVLDNDFILGRLQ